MRAAALLCLALPVLSAASALAEAPGSALRPQARPAVEAPPAPEVRPPSRPANWGGDLAADLVLPLPPEPPALRPLARLAPGERAPIPLAASAPRSGAVARGAGPEWPATAARPPEPPAEPQPALTAAWDGPTPRARPPVRLAPAPPLRPLARAPAPADAFPAAPRLEARISTRSAPRVPPRLAIDEELMGPWAMTALMLFPPDTWDGEDPDLRPAAWRPPSFAPETMPATTPAPRPFGLAAREISAAMRVALFPVLGSPLAVPRAIRPEVRPRNVGYRPPDPPRAGEGAAPPAAAPLPQGPGLCGIAVLQGERVGSVPGPGACGVENGVRVTAVGAVRLTEGAVMDCATATALATWVERVARPALAGMGGGLARIEVMGHYTCRPRNNQPGARLSEHSFGRAIDIGGFRLADGSRITVLSAWGAGGAGQALRAMHRGACGIFGTVLGPEANAAHRNHFHFDTARYRSGAYCR